jgi:hypothetical protein
VAGDVFRGDVVEELHASGFEIGVEHLSRQRGDYGQGAGKRRLRADGAKPTQNFNVRLGGQALSLCGLRGRRKAQHGAIAALRGSQVRNFRGDHGSARLGFPGRGAGHLQQGGGEDEKRN